MLTVTIPDLLDRYAILSIKFRHTPEVEAEWNEYNKAYALTLKQQDALGLDLRPFFLQLMMIHSSIWNFESDIRKAQETYGVLEPNFNIEESSRHTCICLARIGAEAIKIREFNKQRKSVMSKLVDLTNSGWKDIKVNHASQE